MNSGQFYDYCFAYAFLLLSLLFQTIRAVEVNVTRLELTHSGFNKKRLAIEIAYT